MTCRIINKQKWWENCFMLKYIFNESTAPEFIIIFHKSVYFYTFGALWKQHRISWTEIRKSNVNCATIKKNLSFINKQFSTTVRKMNIKFHVSQFKASVTADTFRQACHNNLHILPFKQACHSACWLTLLTPNDFLQLSFC